MPGHAGPASTAQRSDWAYRARAALRLAAIAAGLALTAACRQGGYDGAAQSPPPVAVQQAALALTGRVVDAGNILDAQTATALTARLEQLERQSGPQFVVATTPSLGGREIEAYATDLANTWRLGDAKRNDGLLLLVAPNERRVRIEVGFGLEDTLPDELCARIIAERILPLYRKGDLQGGTVAGADALIAELTAHPSRPAGKTGS
ncbi:MAG: TPM domain-containing protein [Novosphingobium sp.]|uniref:TPM domain-containing protein n=1 Tax=Novosphingobium sp. TaxID=1874826 RepID=UPI0032B8199D